MNKKILSEKDLISSLQRYCLIYLANNNKWYLELADNEHGERRDATTYGPFETEDKADNYINNFSNPGGYHVERKKQPVPIKSPNGRNVEKP